MKYHVKPIGMKNTQGFHQDLHGYDLLLHPLSLREHFKGIYKIPTDIY